MAAEVRSHQFHRDNKTLYRGVTVGRLQMFMFDLLRTTGPSDTIVTKTLVYV
jgi:hypothetical protein